VSRLLLQGCGVLAAIAATVALLLAEPAPARAATYPPGFSERTVFSGMTNPTAIRFASDGRVFVAEKSGLIKVFDSLSDPQPAVFADLRTQVHNFWDRGLLGLALDPGFPGTPYVYVLYTHDAAIGGTAPRWGTAGATSDGCPSPPGPTGDGCVVSGRLSRLTASGNSMVGSEQVLIEDWCQQYPSHSVGSLDFGADGALYVSGGDGASFNFADYGQDGSPLNPCGDPPGGVGAVLTPPSAEGGALRSQDLRTPADPTSLDGALLRVNPATGAGLPDNPNAGSSDANARRIVAYGLRNPFRFGVRPGTGEVWIGDVGWGTWEEIERLQSPTAAVTNFGWPCYESSSRQGGYDSANLSVCEDLYAAGQGAVRAPLFAWHHSSRVVAGETCPTGSSSAAGIAFAPAVGSYPSEYRGALFFADYSRDCIWAMLPGAGGVPDPSNILTFAAGAANPVHLQIGPGGDLFYADFDGGTIRQVSFTPANRPPTAVANATPDSGPGPLTVQFDGSRSSDPDPGDSLSYAWDLDGDGQYDDSAAVAPRHTYTTVGEHTASLRVSDSHDASSTAAVTISVGNSAPTATINSPAPGTTWDVGDLVEFAGSATDAQDGPLPASALSWRLILHHCPSNCHTHPLQSFDGVAGGSFTTPDHEYPSHLELRLTARDSGGLTDTRSVQLNPNTVELTLNSNPGGLALVLNGSEAETPFTRTVIRGSRNSLSAPTPQATWQFKAWSDGGAQTHDVIADATATHTATFTPPNRPPTAIATATPDSGLAPLTVQFDGSTSSDPDVGDSLSHEWDLDGDGQYDDSTAVAPSHTYTRPGVYTASLRVTDSHGESRTDAVEISAGTSAGPGQGGGNSTTPTTPPPLALPLAPLLPLPPLDSTEPAPSPPLRFHAFVTGVIDGDTIKVRRGRRRHKVRLIGIETPEARRPRTSAECGGNEATSRMFRLAFTRPRDRNRDGLFDHKGGKGRRVRVATDPSQGLRDRHGRLLAYVASARAGFATAQLRAGWASVSISGTPFKRLAAFQAAEVSARKASRGIWAQCGGNVRTPAAR
jgi:PKD repeat protein/endonuclease YncB( thermonuclease family)